MTKTSKSLTLLNDNEKDDMALLDTIKKQLGDSPESVTFGGETSKVRDLLRAKSGKAGLPTAGPRQSSLQEKVAETQAQQASKQLGVQGQLQAAQLGQQEADITQRTEQQGIQFQEQTKDIQNKFQQQSNDLLSQFERGQKSLNTNKDIQDLEQVGFQIRLQNDQYVKQLQDIGMRNRLDNSLEFKKQLAKTVFKDQQELLVNDIAFNKLIAAEDREFAAELADMNLDYAMQVADNAARASSQQSIATGIGDLATATLKTDTVKGIFNTTKDDTGADLGAANTTKIEVK